MFSLTSHLVETGWQDEGTLASCFPASDTLGDFAGKEISYHGGSFPILKNTQPHVNQLFFKHQVLGWRISRLREWARHPYLYLKPSPSAQHSTSQSSPGFHPQFSRTHPRFLLLGFTHHPYLSGKSPPSGPCPNKPVIGGWWKAIISR